MAPAASSTSVDRHVVIVVDDDSNVRHLYRDALEGAGMRAHLTATPDQALEMADMVPDACLVLADVHMPGGMDGWDLQRYLRQTAPDLPVVLVTADRLLSIRGGGVRDKPVAADDIAALVRASCTHADSKLR